MIALTYGSKYPTRYRPPVTRFNAHAIRTLFARLGRLPDAGPDEGRAVDILAAQYRRGRIAAIRDGVSARVEVAG